MSRSLLFSLVCVSAGALAQGDPAAPFDRITVQGSDVCIGWQQREIVYTPDAAGSELTPADTEFAAIDASFNTWQLASDACSDFRFLPGERKADTVFGYDRTGGTNDNIVVVREVACREVVPAGDPCFDDGSCSNAYRCWDQGEYTIAITVTSFTTTNGTILDADIALNASVNIDGVQVLFTTVDQPPCPEEELPTCVSTDLQNTVTHEIGHALGLDHVSQLGSTMEFSALLGETHKRVLDHGTRQGLCSIYPAGLPATDCRAPTASLEITADNSGTAFPGCGAAPAGPLGLGLLALLLAHRRR